MLATGALTEESGSDQAPPAVGPGPVGHWTYRTGLALIGVQFAGLVVLSVFTFRRFTLGIDFGIFSQAWTLIGTGHLNPTSTLNGTPYLKSHFELIMWPLALLHLAVHSSYVLLFVQVVALVGTEIVVFTWVTSLLRQSTLSSAWLVAVSAGTVLLLVADPVVYSTVVEDFHFEAVATFFVVFAAFDLWSGRTRRMWVWVVLCLLCGDIGGLYVLGLGLSGLVVRGKRREGLGLLVVGLAWVGLISALGDNQGSDVTTGYAYLAGRSVLPSGVSGLWLLVLGVVAHPDRGWQVAWSRAGTAGRYLLSGGGVGVLTPWGFGVPLVALGTSLLQYNGIFIGIPFQNVVVNPFVTFGSAWLVVWLTVRARTVAVTGLAVVVGVLAVAGGAVESAQRMPTAFNANASAGFVPGPDAAALAQTLARIPADAQVVAPLPTVGRFSQRRFVYLLTDQPAGAPPPIPVSARTVVVVVDPTVTPSLLPPTVAAALVEQLEHEGARVIVSSPSVTSLLWHPPPGVTSFRLP